MSPDPLEKPKRPNLPKRDGANRPILPRNNNRGGGGDRPRPPRNNNRGGGGDRPPSPWLNPDREPKPNPSASFVEYLRWMRAPNEPYKDDTKVQILQIARENARYNQELKRRTDYLKLIAGKNQTFEVSCPWRIRVGGHRGPEEILLPAFDALGMPYIPSSTLRGVARTQAIREFMASENINWSAAEEKVASYFGSLKADGEDRGGKVVFLDAYPLPSETGGLSLDIATSIWNWENNTIEYQEPNPNPFLSLEKPTFLIGLRLIDACQEHSEILDRVKQWLQSGLQAGIGSQVNTGYGKLLKSINSSKLANEFFCLEFELEGQLIHGAKKFNLRQPYQSNRDGTLRTDRRGNLRSNTSSVAEVRPTAFKSMLRYWFRAFALGVMSPQQVETWECQLFGAINPRQKWGWLEVNIRSGKVTQKEPRRESDECGLQEGILSLSYCLATPLDKKSAFSELFKSLTWMMVNLGGIGQGARRPCYSRQNRARPPWYRGSTFYINSEDNFWSMPENVPGFRDLFRQRLRQFYAALAEIVEDSRIFENVESPLEFSHPTEQQWYEVVDRNCRILVCGGQKTNDKPFALSILHQPDFKVTNNRGNLEYNSNLCGQTAQPSPIWIADSDSFQLVTVFGATVEPRQSFIKALQQKGDDFQSIFPLN